MQINAEREKGDEMFSCKWVSLSNKIFLKREEVE